MKEIEKKFLIKKLPDNLEQYKKFEIEQGYLMPNISGLIIRIRKYGDEFILTYKSKIKSNNESLKICREEELPLTLEAYEYLKTKIEGNLVEKSRYIVPLENNLKAEIDIFKGYLTDLKMVEVEFKSEEEANAFIPPYWFDKDVTSDKRYGNGYLSNIDDIKELF